MLENRRRTNKGIVTCFFLPSNQEVKRTCTAEDVLLVRLVAIGAAVLLAHETLVLLGGVLLLDA